MAYKKSPIDIGDLSWLAYINDLRTLEEYAISRVQRMQQLLQLNLSF